nr:odorant receptor 23 [Pachyrhinus yasumatsui]
MDTKNKDKLVSILKLPLITAGLWQRPVTKNPILSKMHYLFSVLARLNFLIFYFSIVTELIRVIVQKYALLTIITDFSVVTTCTKMLFIIIIVLKNDIIVLLDEMTRKEEEVWKAKDIETKNIFNEKVKMAEFFAKSLWVTTFITVASLNVSGIIGNNNLKKYNEANNASVESHFLYQFWFPANKLDHLVLVTIINLFCSYGGIVYNVTTNLLVVVICIHSASHLSILQQRLRTYIPDDFKEDQMDEAIKNLNDLIFQHRYLIAFTTHVNRSCRNIILMEFILTTLDVASVALNITMMNLSDMAWLVLYLPLLILQIYSLAWSTNEVYIQSQAIADAAYESKWYLLNKKGRYLTQIIIQRAQRRPLNMTIGAFGPMTMESFLMIMKGAYSYVSLMKNK